MSLILPSWTSSVKVYYCGPKQEFQSDEGNWRIFVMMKLARSSLMPKGLKWTEEAGERYFVATSSHYGTLTDEKLRTLDTCLTVNFELVGAGIYQPSSKSPPRQVHDPEEEEEEEDDDAELKEWRETSAAKTKELQEWEKQWKMETEKVRLNLGN
jgi:hypothetical protein